MNYRPWGQIEWMLGRIPEMSWSFLGCISTEERSLAAWNYLKDTDNLLKTRLLRITDKPSRFSSEIKIRLDERLKFFLDSNGVEEDIRNHEIAEPNYLIVDEIDDFIENSGENIIIDITTLPKRFFFPIIKKVFSNEAVRNILVTYTQPKSYHTDHLAENYDEWGSIPLFGGDYLNQTPKMLIVGMGFEALGLLKQIEKGVTGLPIKLLLPFPAPPNAYKRSWELVRQVQRYRSSDVFETYRSDAHNVSDTFDRILSLSKSGEMKVLLAPYGPKPMSLGMCLFAILTNSTVYYTQPTVYHPEYSKGIAMIDNKPMIYSYCIRLNGQDFYSL